MGRRRWSHRALAGVLAASLVAAGCGDDDEGDAGETTVKAPSSSAAGGASTTSDGGSATSAPQSTGGTQTTSAPKPATGEPIKLFTIHDTGSQSDDFMTGINAAIESINEHGGVNGRPLEIEKCDTGRDPARAEQCARSAVDNDDVVATVGDTNGFGTQIMPVLEQAGMPAVGHEAYTQADAKSPVAFNSTPGFFISLAGPVLLVRNVEATKIGVPFIDNPAGNAIPALVEKAITPIGGSVSAKAGIPLTATDVSTQVAAIQESDPDGVAPILSAALTESVLQSAVQLGFTDVPFALAPHTKSPLATAESYPELDTVFPTYFNHASEGWQAFEADMEEYSPDGALTDGPAAGWFAVQLFKWAADQATTIDRAGILDVLSKADAVDIGGMTEPLDFTTDSPALDGGFPRIVNTNYYPYRVEDGEFVSLNGDKAEKIFG